MKVLRDLVISKEWKSERERPWGEIPIGHGAGDPDEAFRSAVYRRAGFVEGERVVLISEDDLSALEEVSLGGNPGDAMPCLFLAVYASSGGMAELNNIGTIAASNAEVALGKACELFGVAKNCAGAIQIMPLAGLVDGWSYFR